MSKKPELYIDGSYPGFEKGWDDHECAVFSDDWPDALFEGDMQACCAFIEAEIAAGRAAIASHGGAE